jgi:hypothetical protein
VLHGDAAFSGLGLPFEVMQVRSQDLREFSAVAGCTICLISHLTALNLACPLSSFFGPLLL